VQKIDCPFCQAKKHWQRYIDIETGEVLPENHGRCDNSDKCGKWISPKDTGYSKIIWKQEKSSDSELLLKHKNNSQKEIRIEPIYFNNETFRYTLANDRYEKNVFVQNLIHKIQFPFEEDEVDGGASDAASITVPFLLCLTGDLDFVAMRSKEKRSFLP
jgi:hypothetical protein